MARNAGALCSVGRTMFARAYLSVVSRWARDQLRHEVQTPENRHHLRQLIEATEALGAQLPATRDAPENVVALDAYRRRAS